MTAIYTRAYKPTELLFEISKLQGAWNKLNEGENIFAKLNTDISKYNTFLSHHENQFVSKHKKINEDSSLTEGEKTVKKEQLENEGRLVTLPLCAPMLEKLKHISKQARLLIDQTNKFLETLEPLKSSHPSYQTLLDHAKDKNISQIKTIVSIVTKQRKKLNAFVTLSKTYNFTQNELAVKDLTRRTRIFTEKCRRGGSSRQTRITLLDSAWNLIPFMTKAPVKKLQTVIEHKNEKSTGAVHKGLDDEYRSLKAKWESNTVQKLASSLSDELQDLANQIHQKIYELLDGHANINKGNPEGRQKKKRELEKTIRDEKIVEKFSAQIATYENSKAKLDLLDLQLKQAIGKRNKLLLTESNHFLKLLCKYGSKDLRVDIYNLSSQAANHRRQLQSYRNSLIIYKLDKMSVSISLLKSANSELFSLSRDGGTSRQLRIFLQHFDLSLPKQHIFAPLLHNLASNVSWYARSWWKPAKQPTPPSSPTKQLQSQYDFPPSPRFSREQSPKPQQAQYPFASFDSSTNLTPMPALEPVSPSASDDNQTLTEINHLPPTLAQSISVPVVIKKNDQQEDEDTLIPLFNLNRDIPPATQSLPGDFHTKPRGNQGDNLNDSCSSFTSSFSSESESAIEL